MGTLAEMSGVVWIDGSLQESAQARISPLDHGWTVGNGIFETLLSYDGGLFSFTRHDQRLRQSAEVMGLAVPEAGVLREACEAVLSANAWRNGRARVRITVTGGVAPPGSVRGDASPTVVVAGMPVVAAAPWADVVVVPFTRNASGALVGVKATSYGENVVALAQAQREGASEALFANTEGFLCEGAGSNVFLVEAGVLHTPPLASGCLAGVTRALVLKLAEKSGLVVSEEPIPLARLFAAEEAFLTSTTREVQAIRKIDGQILREEEGPLTKDLREAFCALRDTTLDP